ncbi:C6 zinc finger domain-containing protein [Pochonia chlamydosporia 170]|uniref:C6 zinc finger domain-containing protein n=1 Tax=Pochonia chlamydosporia 170 TaxID=1380566 RepID=A0A179G105_METCM|nr:C6 zinc finger domain-containing protein [Pochonia chlamydosporia 170]OAQ71140.1 C6 zinc finger domain-containing protein [Pochonia chlamydosporia 170]
MPFVVAQEPLPIATGCDAIDMKILWHFLGHTCTSFSIKGGDSRPVEDLMRNTVMDHAFNVRFLYNSVMALSCLHAIETRGDDMGDPLRLVHYQDGLFEAYSAAVSTAHPETYGALLANSLLLTALSSQNFRIPQTADLYIIQWMAIWRGIGTIFKRIDRRSLRGTGLEQLFYRPSMDLDAAFEYIPWNLKTLISSIPANDPDLIYIGTYVRGLRYLATLYQNMHQRGFGAVMKLRVITWFTYLPQDFVQLIFSRNCRALVILAHYAVFLKLTTGVWWLIGVGARSLQDICTFLGPAWYDELEAPMKAIQTENPVELARLLLGDTTWEPRTSSADTWSLQEEEEAKQLTLVDDQGRPVRYESEAGTMVLANPSQPDDEPVWNASL